MTGPKELPDERLVSLFCEGRETAFDELVLRYRLRIFRLVVRFVGNAPRAEELTQETFIRVYRNIRRFDPDLKFSTWIYKIATNLARNEIRDRRRRSPVESALPNLGGLAEAPVDRVRAGEEVRPDRVLEQSETSRAVQDAILELPVRFREVFVLREIEGLSYDEIARIIRRPIGTVRSRVNRARQRFRELMTSYVEETGL